MAPRQTPKVRLDFGQRVKIMSHYHFYHLLLALHYACARYNHNSIGMVSRGRGLLGGICCDLLDVVYREVQRIWKQFHCKSISCISSERGAYLHNLHPMAKAQYVTIGLIRCFIMTWLGRFVSTSTIHQFKG